MNALIIFDVSTRKDELKNNLKGTYGFWSQWASNGVIYNLPTDSLWKPNCELAQARNELVTAINNLNHFNSTDPITLLRCVVVSVNPWDAIPGVIV